MFCASTFALSGSNFDELNIRTCARSATKSEILSILSDDKIFTIPFGEKSALVIGSSGLL